MQNQIAPVELSEPNPEWTKKFDSAKAELESIFGISEFSIEHIGSTSIPNLTAKPEIDVLVGVRNLEDVEKYIPSLNHTGYLYYKKFEAAVPNRKYFRKSDGVIPLVHVHVYEVESDAYRDHILFRDKLTQFPKLAKEYETLKKRLIEISKGDRGIYQEGKAAFITKVIQDAKRGS